MVHHPSTIIGLHDKLEADRNRGLLPNSIFRLTEGDLSLYVWPEFATDHKCGLAFAIARTIEGARQNVVDSVGFSPSCWGPVVKHFLSPDEHVEPIAYAVAGGQ